MTTTSMRADEFINTIGINLHPNYTDGQYANVGRAVKDLKWLGIRHARVPMLDPSNQYLNAKMTAGMKLSAVANPANSPADVVAYAVNYLTKYPGSIVQIEGPNEVNNAPAKYAGLADSTATKTYPATLQYMADLRAAMLANPLTAALPLVGCEGLPPTQVETCDVANYHPYPDTNALARTAINAALARRKTAHPDKPVQFTEFGYNTFGTDAVAMSRLLLNGLLTATLLGVQRTYIYELLDQKPDMLAAHYACHWGLYSYNGDPKPAALAVHNLIAVLTDPAATAATHTVQPRSFALYGASGLDTTTPRLILTRADGSTDLVLWQDTLASQPLTLTITKAAGVKLFAPTASEKPMPFTPAGKVTSFKFDLGAIPDGIAVIRLVP